MIYLITFWVADREWKYQQEADMPFAWCLIWSCRIRTNRWESKRSQSARRYLRNIFLRYLLALCDLFDSHRFVRIRQDHIKHHAKGISASCWYFHSLSATQNVIKYITSRKCKFSRTLLTISSCMLWIDRNHIYSQVLVHSIVVNSRVSPRYIPTFAFIYATS